jgi:WD40 repeat protein
VTAAADGRVWSSDARTGVVIREYLGHTSIVKHVALSPDGRRVAASAADGTIRAWDHDTGQAQFTLDTRDQRADAPWSFPAHPHPHQANRIVFHPAGRLLACAGEDGKVTLWDCDTATCVAVLAAHHSRVPEVDFSPDGRTLASISHDEQLILWDVATHQMIRAMRAHPTGGRTLAFSPDGRTIATGGDDACIRLWDVETGACLKTLEGHQQDVFSVRFSPDGRLLASGERSGTAEGGLFPVFLWDVASGRNLAKLPGHTNHVLAVAFSSDGRYLASCGSDRSVLVRDLTHFDRHIAGNLDEALHNAADVPASSPRVIELRAWARAVWTRAADAEWWRVATDHAHAQFLSR